jgi:hypothetical protein
VYTAGVFNPFGIPNPEFSYRSVYLPSTEAGQLSGSFNCNSFIYGPCLGVTSISYTLPFEIIGLAGTLNYNVGPGQLSDVGFFEFPRNSLAPDGNPYRYTGFWGDTFAPTRTLTLNWLPGDLSASFSLTNAQVVRAVRVPEPGTLALLGTALLGLLAVRRKAA